MPYMYQCHCAWDLRLEKHTELHKKRTVRERERSIPPLHWRSLIDLPMPQAVVGGAACHVDDVDHCLFWKFCLNLVILKCSYRYKLKTSSYLQTHLVVVMAFHGFLLLAKVACISICFMSPIEGAQADDNGVQWYRTAQNTGDRIAKQPGLTFGGDYSFDQVISINR